MIFRIQNRTFSASHVFNDIPPNPAVASQPATCSMRFQQSPPSPSTPSCANGSRRRGKEYKEWFHQTKRWTIGACQVFHYLTKRRYGCARRLQEGKEEEKGRRNERASWLLLGNFLRFCLLWFSG